MIPLHTTQATPRIWALLGARAGDNNQVLALARATGLPFETRRLAETPATRFLPFALTGHGVRRLDAGSRAALVPPWPDLVIAVGRRSVPVARWIRARSGGRTRLVQIGRPRRRGADFDLVVTTPQYGVPAADNVLQMPLPLSQVTPASLAEAAAACAARFGSYPAPRLALLLGGDSSPFELRPADALGALEQLRQRAAERGGSVLIAASRRTPVAVLRAMEQAVATPGAPAAIIDGKLYLGLLALAEEITVTADSASMLADAVAAQKPVGMAPVSARGPLAAVLGLVRWLRRAAEGERVGLPPPLPALLRTLLRQGALCWPRDLWFLWRELLCRGLVGTPQNPVTAGPLPELAAARVRRLLGEPPPSPGLSPGPAPPARSGRDGAPPAPAHPDGGGAA
jgi:mitochondrial fission protein ELM1